MQTTIKRYPARTWGPKVVKPLKEKRVKLETQEKQFCGSPQICLLLLSNDFAYQQTYKSIAA
jgi:hypothetical protein